MVKKIHSFKVDFNRAVCVVAVIPRNRKEISKILGPCTN